LTLVCRDASVSRMNRAAVAACVGILLVAGCASRGSVRQTADDLRALQGEVAALRQSQEDLSRRFAEATATSRAAQPRTEQLAAAIASLKTDIERLDTKVAALDGAVRDVKETLVQRTVAAAPAAAPPATARPTRTAAVEDMFTVGLMNFRNHEYGQAVLDFLDVVTKHPRHELAPTAQYLIGEAYFLQHDYRQALVEFQRAVDWPVPHPKVADALLKVGLCHSHLQQGMEAQIAWRRVVREFPEAPAAEQARLLLDGRRSPAASARRR
jgi:tol-pal system protein YbgF